MKKLMVGLCSLFAFAQTFAQHTVSGLITDKNDNTHLLEGVAVYIPEFNRTDVSKEGGTYILRNVGVGTIHIQFMKRGFRTVLKTIHTRDSATVLNMEMDPVGFVTDEISSFSNQSTLPKDIPFAVEEIDAIRLRRTGQTNMVRALAYEPGVDVYSIGNISRPVIRGLSFNHIQIIQSGSRLDCYSGSKMNDYEFIDAGTESVELIKGPAALIYGSNAMSGVLIIKDEKLPPLGKVNGDLNIGFFTNTLGLNTDLGVKGSGNGGLFYSVRLGGKSHTSYVQGEGNELKKNTEIKKYAYNSGLQSGDAKGVIGITRKWGQSKLTLSYLKKQNGIIQSYTDSTIATFEENLERDREARIPFIDQSCFLASSENILLIKNSKVNLNMSFQSNESNNINNSNTFNYDLKVSGNPLNKAGYTIGFQGYLQRRNSFTYFYTSEENVSSQGVYGLFKYDLERINFLAGARFDYLRMTDNFQTLIEEPIFNGSIGAAWHVTKTLTFKINASTGHYYPMDERLLLVKNIRGTIFGNTSLDLEKNYEGDFVINWDHKNITCNVNAFYNRIENYIYLHEFFIGSNDPYKDFYYSQDAAEIKGGEFLLDLHPEAAKWIDIRASYSGVRGIFTESKDVLPMMPADKVTTSICFQSEKMNYMYHPFIRIILRNYMKQMELANLETQTDAYELLDLNLGGSFIWGQQTFDITVSANNILDKVYFNKLSMLRDMNPVPVRDMGRSISIQLRFPFGIK